jgi:hypothetical protein
LQAGRRAAPPQELLDGLGLCDRLTEQINQISQINQLKRLCAALDLVSTSINSGLKM